MSNQSIDGEGITIFHNFLFDSSFTADYIKVGDKYPIWDGEILLYESYEKKGINKFFKGRVPLQIKSKRVNGIKKSQKNTVIPKLIFQKYLEEGGVLFIKIAYASIQEYKIFGKVILPKDNYFLKKTKAGNVKLALDEIQDFTRLEALCKHFIDIRNAMTTNTLDGNFVFIKGNNDEFVVKTVPDERESLIDSFFSDYTYIFRKVQENTYIPVKGRFSKFIRLIEPISINGKIYFESPSYSANRDGKNRICFSSILEADIGKKEMKFSLSPNPETRFYDLKEAVEFLSDFTSVQSFQIGGQIIEGTIGSVKNDPSQVVEFVRNLEIVFEEFRIDPNKITYNDIYNDNYDKSMTLIQVIALKKEVRIKGLNQEKTIVSYTLGGRTILILFEQAENGCHKGINFFSESMNGECLLAFPDGKSFPCSRFIALLFINMSSKERIDAMKGFYDIIESDLKKRFSSDLTEWYIQFILLLIFGYDSSSDIEYLRLADRMNEFIFSSIQENDKTAYFINKFQIQKRTGNLSLEQKKTLLELKLKSSETKVICCMLILLESYSEFEIRFDEMTEDERTAFRNWPIWNLYLQHKEKSY